MTTIIQNSITSQYLNAKGKWVKEQAEALTFESSLAALGYLFEKRLPNAVLVLRFPDPGCDMHFQPD